MVLQVKLGYEDPFFFKVRKETKMAKVMEAFAHKKGQAVGNLKFTFDGSEIKDAGQPAASQPPTEPRPASPRQSDS